MPRFTSDSLTTHGMSRSRVYRAYHAMLQRCHNENSPLYKYYGARGICVCADWRNPKIGFMAFFHDMGDMPLDHTLERVDNSLGYSKKNCEWRTMKDQSRNKRSNKLLTRPSDGKTMCFVDWAKELGIDRSGISRRLKEGWTLEETLSQKNPPARISPETGRFMRNNRTVNSTRLDQ